jgi:hypothetical protein
MRLKMIADVAFLFTYRWLMKNVCSSIESSNTWESVRVNRRARSKHENMSSWKTSKRRYCPVSRRRLIKSNDSALILKLEKITWNEDRARKYTLTVALDLQAKIAPSRKAQGKNTISCKTIAQKTVSNKASGFFDATIKSLFESTTKHQNTVDASEPEFSAKSHVVRTE